MEAEDDRLIDIEEHDGISVLRMVRGKGNALNTDFLTVLIEALDEVERSPARAMVITGAGKIFCAGVDLPAVVAGGADYIREFLPALTVFFKRLALLPKPVIAAVNGHAIAGGCISVLACDYRVFAQGSGRIGLTELLVGVPFPTWPLEIARFAIPDRYLQDVIYAGNSYLPDEALARGLVDEVVPADMLLDRSIEVARAYSEVPANSFALTKRHLRSGLLQHVQRRIDPDDSDVSRVWTDPEILQRIDAFVAKTIKRGS